MMNKVFYKTVDPRGRITIPSECRKALDIKDYDIIKIELCDKNPIFGVTKVNFKELRDLQPKEIDEQMLDAVNRMPAYKKMVLASMLLESLKGEK